MTRALTPAQISEWAAKGSVPEKIAAHLAEKILSGRLLSFAAPPSNETLADEWDTSERTVLKAKALLAEYGVLRKEGGTYYVT